MRILFLSNFYPPHHIGGYELLCQQVNEALEKRGHETAVLTSTYRVDREVVDSKVKRLLALESNLYSYQPMEAWRYPLVRQRNLHHFHQMVACFRPDLILVWGMWNLSKSLAEEAEALLGSRVVYYLANPWPIEPNMHRAYWDAPAQNPSRRLGKRIVGVTARALLREEWTPVQLRFQHAPCCSLALRAQLLAAGIGLGDAPVIYEGIDLTSHLAQPIPRSRHSGEGKLSLVFVGNLASHKGVHTAIQSLAHMAPGSLARISLTILGAGHPDYELKLHRLVAEHGLSEYVTFQRPIPRSELPALLGEFDVLLLPSIWEEPLALIMQEGLANGLVVVGSATGGTKEIIRDGQNGLLFAPEDASGLAFQIERLVDDHGLRERLANSGRRTAIEQFDFTRMIDQLESYLGCVYATSFLN